MTDLGKHDRSFGNDDSSTTITHSQSRSIIALRAGEHAVANAPTVTLLDETTCIPQHYLRFEHTRASVEEIVCDISYCDEYLIFVCEDRGGIYIQIGIIGPDNYRAAECPPKIVYGRLWRVEPNLPTSEIIQTVFLGLKKAREHEIREKFRFHRDGTTTTPFNTHHDLPLIATMADIRARTVDDDAHESSHAQIERHLNQLSFDHAKLKLESLRPHAQNKWILDIRVEASSTCALPEVYARTLTIILEDPTINETYFQLMDEFIRLSDRHVDTHFTYQNHARFSRANSIEAISRLSLQTRMRSKNRSENKLDIELEGPNYETDATRVPSIYPGRLGQKLGVILAKFLDLEGILPRS